VRQARSSWAIGIYEGPSPLALAPAAGIHNPVLTAADAVDVDAGFVADPFLVPHDGGWYLFFEIKLRRAGKGVIALAESRDGHAWRYRGIVLHEPFHLSYPYVFRWREAWYMVPESAPAGQVRLYRGSPFPHCWSLAAVLLERPCVDASILRRDGRFFMWACTTPGRHERLELFHAEELVGPWHPHPQNPLVAADARRARPAGKPFRWQGRLLRPVQDCHPWYGRQVRLFEVLELSTGGYREREVEESPILRPAASGWNRDAMHHVDVHRLAGGRWLAAVDGHAAM